MMNIKRAMELENNRRMAAACISIALGALIMPHDDPVATIVSKYIFPATVAGILFGIAIRLGFEIIKTKNRLENITNKKESTHV